MKEDLEHAVDNRCRLLEIVLFTIHRGAFRDVIRENLVLRKLICALIPQERLIKSISFFIPQERLIKSLGVLICPRVRSHYLVVKYLNMQIMFLFIVRLICIYKLIFAAVLCLTKESCVSGSILCAWLCPK